MADTLTQFMESLGPVGKFKIAPIFHPEADLLTLFFENEPSYAERVDKYLTVHRSFEGHRLVGFELKGIRHKMDEIWSTLNARPQPGSRGKVSVQVNPHLNLLLTFYMKESSDSSKPAYQSIFDRAKEHADLRFPPELVH